MVLRYNNSHDFFVVKNFHLAQSDENFLHKNFANEINVNYDTNECYNNNNICCSKLVFDIIL